MQQKRIFISFLACLLILLILSGFWFGKNKEKEPQVYKIGAILPLTGNLAFLGEAERNGMLLAEEVINTQGGINGHKLKVIFGDSKAQAKEGVSIFNKFINIDKIKVIITSTTGISRAVFPIAHAKGVILIAFCMDPTIQKDSSYVFRLYESMGQEAETLLTYLKNKGNIPQVGVLYVHHQGAEQQLNDYFKPGFKKLGIKIAFAEPYEISQRDFKFLVAKIKSF